ncbi:hypothetical protein CIPAW_05G213700 [Carya illinoinensis]|uniref:Uncharacterized protein n=1 Tax=Carya illinoinensis TaxID=32201 RepID=A0A8T1QKX4_CARIL|nr:hypothetical protein CIPAW_05G213700 [Carya illinoinensis]
MGASSHIINLATCSNFARALCLLTQHMLCSSLSSGILKRECAVRPPGRIDVVTPDETVASTTNFLNLTTVRSALYRNVFPVPPGPSTKNVAASLKKPFPKLNYRHVVVYY